jgi:hypothetical protein
VDKAKQKAHFFFQVMILPFSLLGLTTRLSGSNMTRLLAELFKAPSKKKIWVMAKPESPAPMRIGLE